jgi:HK97 family phage prohead protease
MERLVFAVSGGHVEGKTLSGVAHVYGSVTVDGRKHSFAPGALGRSIVGDVVSFAFHDDTKPLGSLKAGTLRLLDDGHEFQYAVDLPDTSYAVDLKAYVAAGNELGMSFQYVPTAPAGKVKGVTVWSAGRLLSVDPVALPAFMGTSVILNSAQAFESSRAQLARIRYRLRSND